MPREQRLTRRIDWCRAHARGRSWSNRMLVLCAQPNDLAVSRFGFSVSRRIGGAVVRNRVRRLMREAVRLHLALVAPGWDVVLIARRGASGASFQLVEQATRQLMDLARLQQAPERLGQGE